jgi:hypothetical protein
MLIRQATAGPPPLGVLTFPLQNKIFMFFVISKKTKFQKLVAKIGIDEKSMEIQIGDLLRDRQLCGN